MVGCDALGNIDIVDLLNDSYLETYYGICLLSKNYRKQDVEFCNFYVRYLSFPSGKQRLSQHEIFSVLIVYMGFKLNVFRMCLLQ